jgi:hypothetical protein
MKKMRPGRAQAREVKTLRIARKNKCVNFPQNASPQFRPFIADWLNSAIARGQRRPVSLAKVAFPDEGGGT